MRVRSILFAAAGVLALLGQAKADNITFIISEDGGPPTTIVTGVNTSTIGPFTFGDFNISAITGSTEGFLPPPDILQANQIDVSTNTTGNHTLTIAILGTNLNSPLGLTNLDSQFDATGITPGWSVAELTQINGTNLAVAANFLTVGGQQFVDTATLSPNFTAAGIIAISTNGIAGSSNTGLTIEAAPVPGPLAGAGIPGLLAGFGLFGGYQWKRRKSVAA